LAVSDWEGAIPFSTSVSGATARPRSRPGSCRQDDGDRLAGRRLVGVDRLETATVIMGIEQRELARAREPDPRCRRYRAGCAGGTCAKLSQLDHRRLMRFGATGSGGSPAGSWWLRAQVGFAAVAPPLSEGRIGYEQVAVIAVGIACSDQTRVRAPLEFIPRLAPN
jgi:hypothetical protein